MRLRIILIGVPLFLLTACGASVSAGPDTVVASFYPLAFAAEEVAPQVPVENLTPPGAEPHDIELSPIDAAAIRDARLAVIADAGHMVILERSEQVNTALERMAAAAKAAERRAV